MKTMSIPMSWILDFLRQRILTPRWLVIGMVLGTMAAYADDPRADPLATFFFTFAFLSFWRLFDDTVDRKRDRLNHPERALTRAPIASLAAVLVLGAIALVIYAPKPLDTAYLLAILAVSYLPQIFSPMPWWRWHVAAKYPAVLLLQSGLHPLLVVWLVLPFLHHDISEHDIHRPAHLSFGFATCALILFVFYWGQIYLGAN